MLFIAMYIYHYQPKKKAQFTYLSPLQFFCNYIIGPLSLLLIDSSLKRLRFGTVLFIGATAQNLFLLGGFPIIFCNQFGYLCSTTLVTLSIVISSLLSGIFATFWFVCHPAYINRMTTSHNKWLYFGLSSSIYYTSLIFGNLQGYFLISLLGDFQFYVLMIAISLIFTFLFLLLPQIKDNRQQQPLQDQRPFCQELQFQADRISSMFLSKKFLNILSFLIFNAAYGSAFYLFQTPMILNSLKDKNGEKERVFAVFLTSSIGQAMGGLFSSLLGIRLSLIAVQAVYIAVKVLALTLATLSNVEKLYEITFPAAFLIGMVTTGSQTAAITMMVTSISQDNHAFAAYNLTQCIGNAVSSVIWIIISDWEFVYNLSFMYLITVLGGISLIYYSMRSQQLEQEIYVEKINSSQTSLLQ